MLMVNLCRMLDKLNILPDKYIRGNLKIIKNQELVYLNIVMEISILGNGKKIIIMGRVSMLRKMDRGMKDK